MAAPSPLTQDARPNFQPKIVSLYESLFADDEDDEALEERSEGFWTEFFLLKPYPPGLEALIAPLRPDELLHQHPVTRLIFERCVAAFRAGRAPMDEFALDTLQIFLREVLKKRFMNLSSDVIALLTGLHNVDAVFTDFVAGLETVIRNGRTTELRRKAIQVALEIACGAFQTGLLSYFTHRDLFPALMKFINDTDTADLTYEPFVLLGILANYNKFEFQNPYQLRFDDFVNEGAIKRMVAEVGSSSIALRADYIAIQDDMPEGWSLNTVLSYVGLNILAGGQSKPKSSPPAATNPDGSKLNFVDLPNARAAVLLATHDWVNANKLFCHNFLNYQVDDNKESPISAYLSLTSYLLHHAHRSDRSTLYATLNLTVLRLFLEDPSLSKRLVSDDLRSQVRLCRQKAPLLPVVRSKRPLLCSILDLLSDGISHNLRKRLDVDLYISLIGVSQRAISFLIRTRTRLQYHWSELFKSVLTLIKFLTQYAGDLKGLARVNQLLDSAVNLLTLALCSGELFLPDAEAYDDIFYKLVESFEVLKRFREAYGLGVGRVNGMNGVNGVNGVNGINGNGSNGTNGLGSGRGTPVNGANGYSNGNHYTAGNSINTLISVSEHYYQLIEEKSGKKHLTPQQVQEVIKQGYETLNLEGGTEGGLDAWEKYREADERVGLKKIARVAVEDLRGVEKS
ncbi:hypothetical protein FPQ18DRAFT_316482 [Pyronema domesticum]|nr:hypothetical protein FPQ18DRAFT_316482 [Pyronema domesticum]